MFGNLIGGSQNAVWRSALEGKIPQNYESRSKQNVADSKVFKTRGVFFKRKYGLEKVSLKLSKLLKLFPGNSKNNRRFVQFPVKM